MTNKGNTAEHFLSFKWKRGHKWTHEDTGDTRDTRNTRGHKGH